MLTWLTPAVASLAADEVAKDTWQAGPARARAAALVSALSEALSALAEHRRRSSIPACADSGGPPAEAPSAEAQANAALLVAAAAPPGSEPAVAAALAAAVTGADAMAALLPAALAAALAAARVAGSAAAAEAEGTGADCAGGASDDAWAALCRSPPALSPALRAALRGRLCAAAGVSTSAPPPRRLGAGASAPGIAAAAGSRLPLPRDWPLRALAQPASTAEWAFSAAAEPDSGLTPARPGAARGAPAAAAASGAALVGPLALILALEAGAGAEAAANGAAPLAAAPPAVKLRLLGCAFAAAPEGVIADAAARRLLAALTDRYAAALRDGGHAAVLREGTGGAAADAAPAQGDDEDAHAAAEAAGALCEAFADASFGARQRWRRRWLASDALCAHPLLCR
jgi:hypothetical protein